MKITMLAPILTLTGAPAMQPGPDGRPTGEPILLREVVQTALLTTHPSDSGMGGDAKAKLFTLAMATQEDDVDLRAEDISTIKQRIGLIYPPLIVGRAYELLDPVAIEA